MANVQHTYACTFILSMLLHWKGTTHRACMKSKIRPGLPKLLMGTQTKTLLPIFDAWLNA